MFVEELDQLSARIKDLAESDVDTLKANLFEERATELNGPATSIRLATARIEEFRKRGISVSIPGGVIDLRDTIAKIAADYERERASITEPNPKWRFEVKGELQRLSSSLNASIKKAWIEYVDSFRPESSEGLLRLLSGSPVYEHVVREIREREAEFDRLEEAPITEQTMDRPGALAEEMNKLRNHVPDVPFFVQELLAAISDGTATLANLTTEAGAWLVQNELTEIIVMSWKRNR